MPRLARLNLPEIPQHVIQRGNNKQACFTSDKDRYFYLEKLKEYSVKFQVDIHAYVLMNNHVHMLLTPHSKTGVSLLMQFLGRSYVRYFNNCYHRTGTLWEGRFKSSLVDTEHYFLTVSRYIELNPVRANITTQPQDYFWSSYRANAYGKSNQLITPHNCFLQLGKSNKLRQESYQLLFQQELSDDDLTELRIAANKSQVLGKKKFQMQIERLVGRIVITATHGGDRKSRNYCDKKQQN